MIVSLHVASGAAAGAFLAPDTQESFDYDVEREAKKNKLGHLLKMV